VTFAWSSVFVQAGSIANILLTAASKLVEATAQKIVASALPNH
jgi:hypothetical protein